MKLTRDEIGILRSKLFMRAAWGENQERIHTDKEILDQLIFERVTDASGKEFKIFGINPVVLPVLSHIDLSELSFDDFWWNIDDIRAELCYSPKTFESIANEKYSYKALPVFRHDDRNREERTDGPQTLIKDLKAFYLQPIGDDPLVNLSNCNAKIDFLQSYDYYLFLKKGYHIENDHHLRIYNYNFQNTDLSDSHFEIFHKIEGCDLRGTNAKLGINQGHQFTKLNPKRNSHSIYAPNYVLRRVNVSGLDLSKAEINDLYFLNGDFSYTGVTVDLLLKDYEKFLIMYYVEHKFDGCNCIPTFKSICGLNIENPQLLELAALLDNDKRSLQEKVEARMKELENEENRNEFIKLVRKRLDS